MKRSIKYYLIGFLLCLTSYVSKAQTNPDWQFDPFSFQYDMSMFISIHQQGAEVEQWDNLVVGAFCGDECRGIADVIQTSGGSHFYYLRVRSNSGQGEVISFRCFDKQAGKEIGFAETIVFKDWKMVGYPSDPYILNLPSALAPTVIIWTPKSTTAQKRDWNVADNWTPATVPSSVNTVILPGNLSDYPILTDSVECNTIYFMQGAELGRPDLLKYNRAYVQMNFDLKQFTQQKNSDPSYFLEHTSTAGRMQYSAAVSSTPLDRECWHMLSSPLKGVVTGDLGFGGFPLTFLMKFGPVDKSTKHYNVGKWTLPYTEMNDTLKCTDGFAFYMYGYGSGYHNKPANAGDDGCLEYGVYEDSPPDLNESILSRPGRSYGLRETNGILELPFFEDATGLYAHRTQAYHSATGQSSFYYIGDGRNGTTLNRLTGATQTVTREADGGNYRFIPEDRSDGSRAFRNPLYHSDSGLSKNDEFMVGNPYMSSLNMVEFIRDNAESILPNYYLWNGTNFISYRVDTEERSVSSCDPKAINPGYVAPLQGFFLKTTDTYSPSGHGVVRFDVTKISTVRPLGESNLRSDEVEENSLYLNAENDRAASYVLIAYKENATGGFLAGETVQKLFSPLSYVPQLYALADEIPVDILFVGNGKKETIIPLGIKTDQKGEIRLTFTGMDRYLKASKITFVDASANRTIDLTGKSSATYTFTQTETGIQNGRFSLRIENSMTSLPNVAGSDDLKVYGDSKGIYVVSSTSDPVKQVIVYDLSGRKVYESASDAGYYPLPENLDWLPLIVKVTTKTSVKTVKIERN